ncbi:hypothetical protein DFH06DRAFT_976298, partial [Mycena polygramma]
ARPNGIPPDPRASASEVTTCPQPPPDKDDDELVKKLRQRLRDLLTELRSGAEGNVSSKQAV